MELQNGDKFGRLVVIRKDGVHTKPCGTTQSKYLCRCECGNTVSVLMQNLKNGNTKSCGCLVKELKEQTILPDHRGVKNQIILQYKRHAKDRGLCWELDYETVSNIISSPCFYCGAEKSNRKITKNCREGYEYNGIDRIDSSKGYVLNNVVPCCKTCNRAKLDMSQKDFILWLQKAASHTRAMASQWGGDIREKKGDEIPDVKFGNDES